MKLAKEFFELYRAFWKQEDGKLDTWSKAVRDGAAPDFGPNLNY
jgi:hypothetical protein